jgi:hypothetical protein
MHPPTTSLAVRLAVCAVTLAASSTRALAQTTDFQVNSYTTGHQYDGSAAALPSGEFLVAWHGQGDGDTAGIFMNRFSATGAPAGPQWRVNTYTTGLQGRPSVAVEASGGFVVVWSSFGQDGSHYGVFGQRYDALGFSIGGEFQVNTFTTERQYLPHVQASPTGGFVVVWTSFGSDGNHFAMAGRRYDALGSAIGSEFVVNTHTPYFQLGGRIAIDGAGRFTVAWSSGNQDGSQAGIYAQRYDPSPVGGEFRVNTYTTGWQGAASIAADPDGNFVVVWGDYGGRDGSESGLYAQRFDATGAPQGVDDFRVNTYTTQAQWSHQVAYDAEGRFVVAWTDDTLDGSGYGVFARWFEGDGTPLGPEFQVNQYTFSQQTLSGLAVAPNSDILLVWRDGFLQNLSGVYGRVVPDRIFADGFESGLAPWSVTSTDGGDLSVTGAAALEGSQGLQGVVDDTVGIWVQDDTPENEGRYRARFRIDPNGFDPGEASGARRTRVLIGLEEAPTRRLFAVVLRRVGGQYALMGRARLDDGEQADTGFFNITDAPHAVEVAWTRSSAPDANDGRFQLWIDGALVATLTGLDNHRSALDAARLGALSVKASASGTLLWDAFDSRRVRYVGP